MHRALALIGYPAHLANSLLAPALARLRLPAIAGAVILGLVFVALAVTMAVANLAAYEARPEPQAADIGEIVDGEIASGLWVEFDARLLAGPQRADVELSQGRYEEGTVERIYYLVSDPEEPDQAVIIRTPMRSPAIEAGSTVRLDGTITQDRFNLQALLDEWDLAAVAPDAQFSDQQLIALDFETPFVEPSWVGTGLVGAIAALLILGSLIPDPVFVPTHGAEPSRGSMPVHLAIHGSLPTPHGSTRATGSAARLEWLAVEEVARARWRYWGAALGEVRRNVEDAVRAAGPIGERLVVHGSAGSVLWPIDETPGLALERGTAYRGLRASPAIRFAGDDGVASGVMTFADAQARDRAFAELRHGRSALA